MLMYGRKYQKGVNWITAIAMTGVSHRRGRRALLHRLRRHRSPPSSCGSWPASLGIGMGYHRLLTHRGYKTPKWVEYFLTLCGTLALEGGPIFWVATHRIHHQKSDQRRRSAHAARRHLVGAHGLDPDGKALHHDAAVLARYAPDLSEDPFHVWLSTWHWVPQRRRRPRAARVRRHPVRAVGHLLPHHLRPALHLAGELGDAPVGLAPLPDARRFDATTGGSRC